MRLTVATIITLLTSNAHPGRCMLTRVRTFPGPCTVARRIAVAACLTILPLPAAAQGETERVIWRALLGNTAFDIRARIPGTVRVGLADDRGPMTLEFHASDVRRLADSTIKLLAVRRRRPTGWSVRIEEPGTGAGVASLSYTPAPDSTQPYLFFASDDAVRQVRQSLTRSEARMLMQRFRVAATTATPRPARRRRPNDRPKPG
jgi:hypothetical protein